MNNNKTELIELPATDFPTLEAAQQAVGKKVSRIIGTNFMSLKTVNSVKDITKNPLTGEPAFHFNEDFSILNSNQCVFAKEKI